MVLKTREKILVGVAILAGVVMGFDTFYAQPKNKELAALRAQVLESNEKLAAVTNSMVGLQTVKKRVEEKKKEKDFVSGRISDDRQLPLLLDQMGKESQRKQIDLIQLNINYAPSEGPAEEKGKPLSGSFKKVALEVGLLAGYGTIGPYLDGIQSLPIFLEVEKVDIRRKEEISPKLQITIQQSLYMSKTPFRGKPGQADVKAIQPAS
jgi:Tfp pilus assembly protein PilO